MMPPHSEQGTGAKLSDSFVSTIFMTPTYAGPAGGQFCFFATNIGWERRFRRLGTFPPKNRFKATCFIM